MKVTLLKNIGPSLAFSVVLIGAFYGKTSNLPSQFEVPNRVPASDSSNKREPLIIEGPCSEFGDHAIKNVTGECTVQIDLVPNNDDKTYNVTAQINHENMPSTALTHKDFNPNREISAMILKPSNIPLRSFILKSGILKSTLVNKLANSFYIKAKQVGFTKQKEAASDSSDPASSDKKKPSGEASAPPQSSPGKSDAKLNLRELKKRYQKLISDKTKCIQEDTMQTLRSANTKVNSSASDQNLENLESALSDAEGELESSGNALSCKLKEFNSKRNEHEKVSYYNTNLRPILRKALYEGDPSESSGVVAKFKELDSLTVRASLQSEMASANFVKEYKAEIKNIETLKTQLTATPNNTSLTDQITLREAHAKLALANFMNGTISTNNRIDLAQQPYVQDSINYGKEQLGLKNLFPNYSPLSKFTFGAKINNTPPRGGDILDEITSPKKHSLSKNAPVDLAPNSTNNQTAIQNGVRVNIDAVTRLLETMKESMKMLHGTSKAHPGSNAAGSPVKVSTRVQQAGVPVAKQNSLQ